MDRVPGGRRQPHHRVDRRVRHPVRSGADLDAVDGGCGLRSGLVGPDAHGHHHDQRLRSVEADLPAQEARVLHRLVEEVGHPAQVGRARDDRDLELVADLRRQRGDRLEIPDQRRGNARRVGEEDVLGGEEVARRIGICERRRRRERGERRDGGHREPGPRPDHAGQRNEGAH